MQFNGHTALRFFDSFHHKFCIARTFPTHSLINRCTGTTSGDYNLISHNKCRIKTYTKLANQSSVFLLISRQF